MSEERNLTLSKSSIATLDEALAWAVQALDKEFRDATMVKLTVEQMMRSGPGINDSWESAWTASVRGALNTLSEES